MTSEPRSSRTTNSAEGTTLSVEAHCTASRYVQDKLVRTSDAVVGLCALDKVREGGHEHLLVTTTGMMQLRDDKSSLRGAFTCGYNELMCCRRASFS
jgi:hypothetical protein